MSLALALILSCTVVKPAPSSAATGEVQVRVIGTEAEDDRITGGCGHSAAAVWVDESPAEQRPGHTVVGWRPCGPSPALSVLTPGSTIVLRNDGVQGLELRWEQPDGGPGAAELAVGGERRVVLGHRGALKIISATGNEAVVVVGAVGALTDASGRVTLASVRAGAQAVHVLHPTLGRREAKVTVPEGQRVMVEVELPGAL